tara:strand:- start:2176 stop:2763 length:588 start_codon:yes stop_codon:yes gene_type:complete
MESKQIIKPTSAFQYYLKNWKNLSDEEKAPFELMAQRDKNRYNDEIKIKEEEEEEEVINQQIYLTAYAGGYSSCGLDNGAKSYETVGPVVKIIEYSNEDQKKWGVKVKAFEYRDKKYNCKFTLHHNQKYHIRTQWGDKNKQGDNVYTYGTSYNFRKDNPYNPIKKFHICKTPPKHIGTTTEHYTSFDNTTWSTHH